MNKKVLTLCAGFLLASAVGTASAQNYAKFASSSLNAATKIVGDTYYQIGNTTDNKVLAMIPDGGRYKLKMISATDAVKYDLRYTLWTIATSTNAEGGYSYSFYNYATGMQLGVDTKNAKLLESGNIPTATTPSVYAGGNVNVWKWVAAPDPSNKTFEPSNLIAAFGANSDSVAVLTTATSGAVNVVKYASKDFAKAPSYDTGAELTLVPVAPEEVLLGVDDLNSMLWKGTKDGKLKLTFTPDVNENEFPNVFAQELTAESAIGYPFRNFKADLPTNISGNSTAVADAAEDALGKHNNWYEALNAYEIAQHQATFANAIKALVDADVPTSEITSALNAFKGLFVTDYATGLEAVLDKDVTTETGKKVQPIVVAFIKSEMPNVKNNNSVDKVNDVIDAVVSNISDLAFYVNGLDLDAKKKAADKEKEDARQYWDAQGWVSLKTNKGNYLMVDTAYMTSDAGQKYLKISDDKKFVDLTTKSNGESLSPISWTREDINGRFNFQFVWYPAQDSIVIRSAGFAELKDSEEATTIWKDMTLPESMVPMATGATGSFTYGGTTINVNETTPAERNLIKIAVLGNSSHRELTIGNSEYDRLMDPANTINTRISANAASMYELTTLPSGVYFFNLATTRTDKMHDNGKYYVAKFCGDDGADYEAEETTQLYGIAQDFGHMPRTQWVVEQNAGTPGRQTVNIYNREFPDKFKYENVQLYKAGDGKVFALSTFPSVVNFSQDTLSYALANTVKPNAGVLTDKYLGYYKPADENEFQLNRVTMDYFSGIEIGNFVNVSSTANDTTVFVDVQDGKATFQLVPSKDAEYGYDGTVAPQLYRRYYTVKVYDGNKLVNNAKWIARDEANENTYKVTADETQAVKFYLKENNQLVSEEGDTTCYYALVDFENADRVGVRDGSLKFTIEDVCEEERVATFAVKYDESIIYRELNGDETVAIADGVEPFVAPCVANFYRSRIADKQYLFESAHQGQFDESGNINYLGVRYQGGEFNDSTAIYVDTADVRNPYRPQYMLAVGTEIVPAGKYCPIHGFGASCLDEHLVDVPAQVWGRYLINAQDSLSNANGKDYLWENQYTRLAFVEAMHTGDTLVIFKNGEYPLTDEGHKDYLTAMEWAREAAANTVTPGENDHVYVMNVKDRNGNNATKTFVQDYANYKFMFRLVNDEDTRNFIIESHDGEWGLENNTYTAAENANEYRAIKVQNGVPVIARHASANEAILNAEWWNIDDRCSTPTANESIVAGEVSVVATDGAVIVKGAEGKNVIVSTILGKVVANEVLNSDNETIAAPAGIVVVSVDGESFKVAVK